PIPQLIPFEGRTGSLFLDEVRSDTINLSSRNSRANTFSQFCQNLADDAICGTHNLDFLGRFEKDHDPAEDWRVLSVRIIRSDTSSSFPVPSISYNNERSR